MKKLLCILMACLLALTLCAPALAEESEPLVGGWTPTEGDPTQIPEEVLTAFAKATEDLEGCTYSARGVVGRAGGCGNQLLSAVPDPDCHPGRAYRLCAGVLLRSAGRQRPSAESAGDRVFRL